MALSKTTDRSAPDPKALEDSLFPLLREMAQSIFTRKRIEQLISQLRKYRNEHFATGDKIVANHATATVNYLEQEHEPGLNRFLVILCLASLRAQDEDAPSNEIGPSSRGVEDGAP